VGSRPLRQLPGSWLRTPVQLSIVLIHCAESNVRAFALAQRNSLQDFELEIQPGVHLGQKNLPINSVGT